MGSSDAETPTKASKSSSSQEQQPAASATGAAVYADWGGFQAYSPMPPHGFFPSPIVSGAQAPPYVWGAQHIMPPYAAPPHPYVVYPHGGIYAHPSLHPGSHPFSPYTMPSPNGNVEGPGAANVGEEVNVNSSDGKERSPLKASKQTLGSLNMITGMITNEPGRNLGASNGAASHSGESGSEDSSEGSDANSQKDLQAKTGDSEAEVTPNGSCATQNSLNEITHSRSQAVPNHGKSMVPMQLTGAPAGVSGPTTNLNIGIDYWGAPVPSSAVPMRAKISNSSVVVGLAPSSIVNRENISSDNWLQDEREFKRQRRKQSNRESARRSRLRKQAECEELGQRVNALKEENAVLREELNHLRNECQQLQSQNISLKESLDEVRKKDEARLDLGDSHSCDYRENLDSGMQEGSPDVQGSS